MEIIVKKRGSTRGAGPSNKVTPVKMSLGERQSLQQEKAELEQHIDERANPSFETSGNKELTLNRLKEIKGILDSDASVEVKGRERDRLVKRQAELADFIKLRVPPYHIQNAKAGTPEYQRAMTWGEEASKPEVVRICGEYQNVSRLLDPENPSAGDIEVLTSST